MRWMPNTSDAPTPVSARIVPVMTPLRISCANSCRLACTVVSTNPLGLRADAGPRAGDLGLELDGAHHRGSAIGLVLPDIVGGRGEAAGRRELDRPGGADEMHFLAPHHALNRLVDLLEAAAL